MPGDRNETFTVLGPVRSSLEKDQQLTVKVHPTSGMLDELMDPEVQAFLKKRREA